MRYAIWSIVENTVQYVFNIDQKIHFDIAHKSRRWHNRKTDLFPEVNIKQVYSRWKCRVGCMGGMLAYSCATRTQGVTTRIAWASAKL